MTIAQKVTIVAACCSTLSAVIILAFSLLTLKEAQESLNQSQIADQSTASSIQPRILTALETTSLNQCQNRKQNFPQTVAEAAAKYHLSLEQIYLLEIGCQGLTERVVTGFIVKAASPVKIKASGLVSLTEVRDCDQLMGTGTVNRPAIDFDTIFIFGGEAVGTCILVEYLELINTGGEGQTGENNPPGYERTPTSVPTPKPGVIL